MQRTSNVMHSFKFLFFEEFTWRRQALSSLAPSLLRVVYRTYVVCDSMLKMSPMNWNCTLRLVGAVTVHVQSTFCG